MLALHIVLVAVLGPTALNSRPSARNGIRRATPHSPHDEKTTPRDVLPSLLCEHMPPLLSVHTHTTVHAPTSHRSHRGRCTAIADRSGSAAPTHRPRRSHVLPPPELTHMIMPSLLLVHTLEPQPVLEITSLRPGRVSVRPSMLPQPRGRPQTAQSRPCSAANPPRSAPLDTLLMMRLHT